MDGEAVQAALASLEGWSLGENGRSLTRVFRFKTFSAAWAFMSRAALLAEKLDHHPDWSNSYNTVSVSLSTHDAGGLTTLDFRMAEAMGRYFQAA